MSSVVLLATYPSLGLQSDSPGYRVTWGCLYFSLRRPTHNIAFFSRRDSDRCRRQSLLPPPTASSGPPQPHKPYSVCDVGPEM